MKITPSDKVSLKRPADEASEPRGGSFAQKPRMEASSPSRQVDPVKRTESETALAGSDSLENKGSSSRPTVSFAFTGLAKPKSAGISSSRPNALLDLKKKSEIISKNSKPTPIVKRGEILMQGPNPLESTPYWRKDDLDGHAPRHLKDTNSRDQHHYEKKSLDLMTSPVTPDRPAYVRETGAAQSERFPGRSPPREAGDVVRHDRQAEAWAVAKANGRMRTYHGRDTAQPGYTGLQSEAADDYLRRMNSTPKPKK